MIDRLSADGREAWEERVAIMTEDGSMEVSVAEGLAMCLCCRAYLSGCPVAPAREARCVEFRPDGW